MTVLACLTLSCSKSDDSSSNVDENLAEQQNETENRTIPTAELQSGIRIKDAISKTGTPPSPSGNLDFQISTDKQEAFQEAGFDIKFSTLDNIQGVYILFQDSDGNKLENYLDVPLSALQTGKFVRTKEKKSNKHYKSSKQQKTLTGDDYTIDVDFDNIAPGNFCYEICLYDGNNNISAIQTICVEVEAWGGNSEISGEWVFDRSADGDDESDYEVTCQNGGTVTVTYNDDETWTLVLNADGSYYETYKGFYEELDYEATASTCTVVTNKVDVDDKYTGNWAYNEDKETLTIIDFKYENFLDASENETYADGEVYFDGNNTTAKIISSELVIVDTYFDGIETYTETLIFKIK